MITGVKQGRISFADAPERILVVLPNWVGDVVMATPFLRAVRKRFAGAHLIGVLHRHLDDLLRGGDLLDERVFWPSRRRSWAAHRQRRTFRRELRARRLDLAILLPNSFRSAWFAWRTGARRRVGYRRDGRGLLLTDGLAVRNRAGRVYQPIPLVEYYADLAEALNCERPGDDLELVTTPDCDRTVDDRLHPQLQRRRPLVVLCPGAKFGASKCWPTERFAAVADRLIERNGAAVAISPGPGEEPLARAIAEAMRCPALLLDQPCLTLGELMSLIRRADLLLGNDTGPRHFARAFDVPRVTVFGPTEPRWTATSHDKEHIVRVDVECGPCHKKVCPLGHLKCMTLVTVDMVEGACQDLLAARDSRA